jgi:hypothetical protein
MRKYRFGECISESIKVYNRLKRQGKNPIFIEGWAEVFDPDGVLEPDKDFLNLFAPEILKKIEKGEDYPRVLPHTFIICDRKIIDITRNQFDQYGGIECYYEKCRYWWNDKYKVDMWDIEMGGGAEFIEEKRIHYPEKK